MRRSAVLTLGGALLLGGASAVHADDLSGSDPPTAWTIAPAMYGVFSRVPENWSDLPVQLQVSETMGYNSNILNTPLTTGGTTTNVYGAPIASLTSVSNFRASTKAYWEGQEFFADGSLGMYRYFSDDALNTLSNSFDIGDNWTYGSKCSGTLTASERTSPSVPGFQVGFNVRNVVTTLSFNETATCPITGNYGFILNSGATKSTNSAAIDTLNDSESEFIAAGISYTVSDTNSLQFLTTVTGTNYTGRQGSTVQELNTVGLLNNITQDQLSLTYTKNSKPQSRADCVGRRGGRPQRVVHPGAGFRLRARIFPHGELEGDAEAPPAGFSVEDGLAPDLAHRQPAGDGERQSWAHLHRYAESGIRRSRPDFPFERRLRRSSKSHCAQPRSSALHREFGHLQREREP